MKTKIDEYVNQYVLDYLETGEFGEDGIKKLLEKTREVYDIDKVDVCEIIPDKNAFIFTYASVKDGIDDNLGKIFSVNSVDYDELSQIYDEEGLSETNVASFDNVIEKGSILHFCLREESVIYGMVGYQSREKRKWTVEEKCALIKLARAIYPFVRMKQSKNKRETAYTNILKDANNKLRKALNNESQFKKAIMSDNVYCYTFNVSKNIIEEELYCSEKAQYIEIYDKIGLKAPCVYEDFIKKLYENCLETERSGLLNIMYCNNLIEMFNNDITNIDTEFAVKYHEEAVILKQTNILTKDMESEEIYSICFVKDVTEKRKKEYEAKKTLKEAFDAANYANNSKSEFFARMSHDIRTPMNSIIGMTAIANAHKDDKDKLENCLNKISESSKHLLGIINDILDMSKIEAGKMNINEEVIVIDKIIEELVAMTKAQIKEKHQDLYVNIHDVEHKNVYGDKLHIMQAFTNILNNAIKYTPDGGVIRMSVYERATKTKNAGCYEFVFEDNGIGMSKEYLEHIFEPFEKANDISVSNMQGTGLGMTVTKSIVQMMNGEIKVESEPGKGSKFTVIIYLKLFENDDTLEDDNLEVSSEDELSDRKERKSDFKRKNILVVEDNELNREIMVEILRETGASVYEATNGQEAVRMFEQYENDFWNLILMDIQMPIMNGYDACVAIRSSEKPYAKNVPIIAMTANAFDEDVNKIKEYSLNEYISKPIDINVMMKTIGEFI